jgi:hypothetical protein
MRRASGPTRTSTEQRSTQHLETGVAGDRGRWNRGRWNRAVAGWGATATRGLKQHLARVDTHLARVDRQPRCVPGTPSSECIGAVVMGVLLPTG